MASRTRGFRRIVHYYPRAVAGDGGVTNSVRAWATAIADAGARVTILHHGGERKWPVPDGIESLTIPHRGGAATVRTLRPHRLDKFLEQGDLLILHSGWWLYNLVAGAAARRAGIPYVVVPHGAFDPNIRFRRRTIKAIWEPAEVRAVRGAAAVHLFFQSEVPDVKELAPESRTIVVPTGQDPLEWKWLGSTPGYLAWLGRFDIEHKGLDLLIEAVAKLPEAERPRLGLAGTEFRYTRRDLMSLVERFMVEKWVDIMEPVYGEAKIEFLQRCDAFVYPSRWESYGMSVVEALAAGVPTVISSTMHIAELVGEATVVSEPTAAAIAQAIKTVLSQKEQLSKAGPELVARELDWPRLAKRWLDEVGELATHEAAIR